MSSLLIFAGSWLAISVVSGLVVGQMFKATSSQLDRRSDEVERLTAALTAARQEPQVVSTLVSYDGATAKTEVPEAPERDNLPFGM